MFNNRAIKLPVQCRECYARRSDNGHSTHFVLISLLCAGCTYIQFCSSTRIPAAPAEQFTIDVHQGDDKRTTNAKSKKEFWTLTHLPEKQKLKDPLFCFHSWRPSCKLLFILARMCNMSRRPASILSPGRFNRFPKKQAGHDFCKVVWQSWAKLFKARSVHSVTWTFWGTCHR